MKIFRDEIIEKLATEAESVFVSRNLKQEFSKNMLVIIPDLKLSGSLTVLMELLYLFMEHDYGIYVISSEDGEYREQLLNLGVVVAIRPYVICTKEYRRFLQSIFDCVFMNTASVHFYIYYFLNTNAKVIWWLHETKMQLETMQSVFPYVSLLSSNVHVAGVTQAVCRGIKELCEVQISNLPMPIADCRTGRKIREDNVEKTIFFIPAAYTYIKGQDVLLQAIMRLPEKYVDRVMFVFCGYQLEGQKVYYEKIKKISSQLKSVTFLEELDKQEVYEWYERCDCVIAPSRVDATPTTIIEAMMFERLCIVSNATGISEYMQDCVNGFIFQNENVEELLKRILLVIADGKSFGGIAKKGREIYEKYFSVSAVWEKLRDLDKDLF